MASAGEVVKTGVSTLEEEMKRLGELQSNSSEGSKVIHSELWHACAGPLVTLPQPGSLVYYFPQGHGEQVMASTTGSANPLIPSYSGLSSQMMCQVQDVALHADKESDDVYAQITLQPVNSESDVLPTPDFGLTKSKQPVEFFCKTLTVSDTSTHGGFSVPRRAAEKLFPLLDYSTQSPCQELVVRDLHDNSWTFRHVYRGQPKRHLLTTGWSVFIGAKQLKAGDSVLFVRVERSQLMIGVRHANRQHGMPPSSVLSADSMHIGVLAVAAHAAANRSPFTVFYNPRACPSQFVVPLVKYHKVTYGTQVSIGMRFGMMFETEDSTKRRCRGTITGISDFDPLRWPNSKWRNLQVEWDENDCVNRPDRVSSWEIEIPDNLFSFLSPSLSMKRPYSEVEGSEDMARKAFLETSGSRSGSNMCLANPSVDSKDLVKNIFELQNLFPSAQLGCEQLIYSSVLRNLLKGESPVSLSITPECVMVGNQETICKSEEMQYDRSLCLQKSKHLLQNFEGDQYASHFLEKHVMFKTELDTQQQTSQGGVSEGSNSTSVMTEQCQNDMSEKKNDVCNSKCVRENDNGEGLKTSVSTANQPKKFSQITIPLEKQKDERLISNDHLNIDDSLSFTNQAKPFMDEGRFQLVQSQKNEASILQPEQHETLPTNTNELNSSPCDVLGWMLKPAGQSSFQTPKLYQPPSTPSKEDYILSRGLENTVCSADISAVLNQEGVMRFQRGQDVYVPTNCIDQCSPVLIQELLKNQYPNCPGNVPLLDEQPPCQLGQNALGVPRPLGHNVSATAYQDFSKACGLKGSFDENGNPNDLYSPLCFKNCTEITTIGQSVSSTSQEVFSTERNSGLTFPSSGTTYDFNSYQDVQSNHSFSLQGFRDASSNASSSNNIDLCENSLMHKGSRKQLSSLRTYTKVQKFGSVGRSIDVNRFRNYDELKSAIASMFGLEGQLDDPTGLGWRLVYMDYENDVLLIGDDPWEEFISCVRCIRILSASEIQQMMSHKGMDPTNVQPRC